MTKRTDYPSAAVRIRVMKRDKFRCAYCGVSGTDAELEVDHIHPKSKGGSNHMSNLTTACRACNQSKSNGDKPSAVRPADFPSDPTEPLVGMFLHTLTKEGKIQHQGYITAVTNGRALVQLLSFMDGYPTSIVPMLVDVVLSPRCVLYKTAKDMRYGWCKEAAAHWMDRGHKYPISAEQLFHEQEELIKAGW